jgi:predicted DNA-binding transcriptional regulator YafY
MSKSDRLLHEINLLKTRQTLYASDFAKECGVSKRTVYRDILSLSSAKIPVYFDNGYKILPDAFLPSLNFTLDEYLVLRLALTSDLLFEKSPLSTSAKSALAKIEGNLNPQIKPYAEKIKNSVKIQIDDLEDTSEGSPAFGGGKDSPLIFNLLKQSILNNQAVKFFCQCYPSEKVRCSEIEPHALVFFQGDWGLVGFCLAHKEFHLFPMSQIKKVMLLGRAFERQKKFDLEQILRNCEKKSPDSCGKEKISQEGCNIRIEFSKDAVSLMKLKTPSILRKVKTLRNGEIVYSAKVENLDDLLKWISGIEGRAEVFGSPKATAKDNATRINKIYPDKDRFASIGNKIRN